MPTNQFGNYIRERRQDLGLTQEGLASRIGGAMTQADISRLERGGIAFPRRTRLEALAVALEVPLSTLLTNSGWLTGDETAKVEGLTRTQAGLDASMTQAALADVVQLRELLLTAIERIGTLEETMRASQQEHPHP